MLSLNWSIATGCVMELDPNSSFAKTMRNQIMLQIVSESYSGTILIITEER